VETLFEEVDVERVGSCSLELFDDRQEVGQCSDRLEGRRVFRSEGSPGGCEDERCFDDVQWHVLVEEPCGEASIVATWLVRCVWHLDVAFEECGHILPLIDGFIWCRGGHRLSGEVGERVVEGVHDVSGPGCIAAGVLSGEDLEVELLVDLGKLVPDSLGEKIVAHVGEYAEVACGVLGQGAHDLG